MRTHKVSAAEKRRQRQVVSDDGRLSCAKCHRTIGILDSYEGRIGSRRGRMCHTCAGRSDFRAVLPAQDARLVRAKRQRQRFAIGYDHDGDGKVIREVDLDPNWAHGGQHKPRLVDGFCVVCYLRYASEVCRHIDADGIGQYWRSPLPPRGMVGASEDGRLTPTAHMAYCTCRRCARKLDSPAVDHHAPITGSGGKFKARTVRFVWELWSIVFACRMPVATIQFTSEASAPRLPLPAPITPASTAAPATSRKLTPDETRAWDTFMSAMRERRPREHMPTFGESRHETPYTGVVFEETVGFRRPIDR